MKASVVLLFATAQAAIKVGDWACADAGANVRDSPCGKPLHVSIGTERGKVSAVEAKSCSMGNFTWVTFQEGEGGRQISIAVETNLIKSCNPQNVGKMLQNVPYVNQRYDVGDAFDGDWACGPTTALMAMAFWKKMPARPIISSKPWNHSNDFGWYDSHNYTSSIGHHFDRQQPDPTHKNFMGAWGSCTDGGGAVGNLVQSYVKNHGGLNPVFFDRITFNDVKNAIDKGHPIILDTLLSSVGHLVLAIGYTTTGNVIVNDPWGNKNQAHWGGAPNGKEVEYTPSMLHLGERWAVVPVPTTEFNAEDWPKDALAPAPEWARSGNFS